MNHIKPTELRKLGEDLAGSSWQSHFAWILNVNPRTVRRWVSGDSNIPENVKSEILDYYKESMKGTHQ